MGITIFSKNLSNDMGYGGFRRLRRTIGNLIPCDELREHYMLLDDVGFTDDKEFYKKYDAKTERLYRKYRKKYGKIIDFLYCSDCEGKFGHYTAIMLLNLIGDYDDDQIYGYAGWEKPMRLEDFKDILKDAVNTKSNWGWR